MGLLRKDWTPKKHSRVYSQHLSMVNNLLCCTILNVQFVKVGNRLHCTKKTILTGYQPLTWAMLMMADDVRYSRLQQRKRKQSEQESEERQTGNSLDTEAVEEISSIDTEADVEMETHEDVIEVVETLATHQQTKGSGIGGKGGYSPLLFRICELG